MDLSESLFVAKADDPLYLLPSMANRHGLIAGATGTGKTVTLQVIAERCSRIGIPSFMADVKGDLSGIGEAGVLKPRIQERITQLGLKGFEFEGCPVAFWDVFGEKGHPVRATVSAMGPLLFGRLLNLNETQTGVLTVVFKIADDNGWMLLDLKDLRSMLEHVGSNAASYRMEYGNVSAASVGTIQRSLLALEEQGGDMFFGEPMLDLDDLLQTDSRGRGVVNILASDRLLQTPKVYATFLLWLLSELFEELPEVGDLEKPKLLFFFDEAHLLFDDAPRPLVEKIEQVVRLVRSKGVGVFFITQNPLDIPDAVLGQLGNRVQHALRAFTPRDQKAVRAAAETFRSNPKLNVEQVIGELAVGEALVSFLDDRGTPGVVERAFVCPPFSQIGLITEDRRASRIKGSSFFGHYEKAIDRESAYEMLRAKVDRRTGSVAPPVPPAREGPAPRPRGRQPDTLLEATAKSVLRAAGSQLGRQIMRGILGSILGGGKR